MFYYDGLNVNLISYYDGLNVNFFIMPYNCQCHNKYYICNYDILNVSATHLLQ